MQNTKVFYNLLLILVIFIFGCASPNRLGMITDPDTGLQYGAVVEKSFFIDASQFENNKIKITARNVSGDINYNIRDFIRYLETSFMTKGYKIGRHTDFGLKYDVII